MWRRLQPLQRVPLRIRHITETWCQTAAICQETEINKRKDDVILGAAALQRQENCKEPNYQRTRMQKDVVIQELKKRGCRITKQRRMLLEVILENECSCCKEIYYNASRLDPVIGSATVYRMVNLLEEIGAISWRNMYKIVRNPDCKDESVCTIELDDNTVQKLSKDSFNNVVLTGLKACGYIDKQEIERMFVNSCDFKHWKQVKI